MNRGLRQFEAISLSPEVKVVSVDIFDTILFRTTMPEYVKFWKIAREQSRLITGLKGGEKITPRALLLARTYSARIRYRTRPMIKNAREATYAEILGLVYRWLQMSLVEFNHNEATFVAKAKKLEIDIETDDLHLNEQLAGILKLMRKRGKKIIGISDIYFSSQFIGALISRTGGEGLLDNIYASSEFGYGKASGALFDQILALEKIKPQEMAHIGDNYHSDFVVPSERGIQAVYQPRSLWWRFIREFRTKMFLKQYGVPE